METVMETASLKLNLLVDVWPKASSSSMFLSSVVININEEIEEFLKDENVNTVTSLGTYLDPSSRTDSLTLLEFKSFERDYVYQTLQNKFHDHVLSQHMCNKIVHKAREQRRRSQSLDIALSLEVFVTLTRKEYSVVPCNSSPTSTRDLEKESETCSICFENLFGFESEKGPICQMPNCSHLFHEDCVVVWLNRNDSCPLCRQLVNEQQE